MANKIHTKLLSFNPLSAIKIDQYNAVFISFLFIGVLVHLVFILPVDFPLHDGGLFFVMIKDIEANNFSLPWFTSYNFNQIPFAYPPLAFYLGAILNQIFGIDILIILQYIPFLLNLFTAFSAYYLSRTFNYSKSISSFAFLAFLLLPDAFQWLIMGGGLTRSLGFLFAILSISMIYRVYSNYKWKYVIFSGIFSSLVIVSHLEMAWFTFYSAVLIYLFYGRTLNSAINSIIIAGITLMLTSPWWFTIISRFGISIFISSVSGGSAQWPYYQGIIDLFFNSSMGQIFFQFSGA
jgi:hypothetical protein